MRSIIRAVSAALLVSSIVVGGAAHADVTRVEKADRLVSHPKRVTYVEPTRRESEEDLLWYVEFRDGSSFLFTPCEVEDERNCYWDAGEMGNGAGESFVNLRGRLHYLTRGSK